MNEEPIEAAFVHCPRCAAANPEPGAIPFRCPACGLTLYFGPCAAVGALIEDEQQRLLLVRRAKDPGKGRWGLPGGFVDRDETAEEALTREVLEETALELISWKLLLTRPNRYAYAEIWVPVIDLFYHCRAELSQPVEVAEDELQSAHWVHPAAEHLENMAFVSNRLAVEYWLRSRSRSDF